MEIKAKRETRPVTPAEALAALWRIKLRLGQYPIRVRLARGEPPSLSQEK